jgi:hypothetical protein
MNRSTRLTCAAIAIAALVSVSSITRAALVDQDTGEGYIPTFDHDGNLEDPPSWVPQVDQSQTATPFHAEVLVDEDYCWSAVDEWIGDGDTSLVYQAMGNVATRGDLFSAVEGWIQSQIADKQDELPAGVTIDTASLASLGCPSSTYTYLDCLQDGISWVTCKRMYPMQAVPSHSELTVSLSVSAPAGAHGTIALAGGLRYRETTAQFGGPDRLGCFEVGGMTVTGFTGLQGVVEDQVSDLFDANGELCFPAP